MSTVRVVRTMHNTSPALYTAQASTPPVQTPVTPAQAATGLDWTPILIPLLFSGVTAAIVGGIFQLRINAKNREHAKELEEIRNQNNRSFEDYRQKLQGRKELIETWEKLLNDPQVGILGLINHPKYGRLEEHFTKELLAELGKYIEYSLLVNDGIIPPTTAQEKYLRPSDEEFRDKLKQALTELKREWGLY